MQVNHTFTTAELAKAAIRYINTIDTITARTKWFACVVDQWIFDVDSQAEPMSKDEIERSRRDGIALHVVALDFQNPESVISMYARLPNA